MTGMYQTPTYNSWSGMKQRCNNPKNPTYEYYGARGIAYCERWESFENFLHDMGPAPHGLTLERKDNSLGYSPENCRWATRAEQTRNTRHSRLITFNGETLLMVDWSKRMGFKPATLAGRFARGWTVERAMTTPEARSRVRIDNRTLTFGGETRCLADWSERLGFNKSLIQNRLRQGWSVEAILTTPVRPRLSGTEINPPSAP